MSQPAEWGMPLAGPATQTELSTTENGMLNALLSCHSGTSRPTYAVAGTVWLDTTGITVDGVTGIYVLNIYDGADDIPLIYVDPTNNRFWSDASAPEVTVASGSTTDVLGAGSPRVYVTGNSGPITSLGDTPNKMVWVRLEDDIIFTNSATLVCPGGTDYAASAEALLLVMSDSNGVPTIYPVTYAIASQDEAEAGTDNTKLMTPLRVAQQQEAQVFESAQQAITDNGLLTIAHGLGVKPREVWSVLVCVADANGLTAGQELSWGNQSEEYDAGGSSSAFVTTGWLSWCDETNIYVRYGISVMRGIDPTTGNRLIYNSANYRLVVRARK